LLTRLTNSKSDRFIAVSRAIKEDLLAMGIPSTKVDVIYNGLDRTRLIPNLTPEEVRERLKNPVRIPSLIYGRKAASGKGSAVLFGSASQLAKHYNDLVFMLVEKARHGLRSNKRSRSCSWKIR
jgi:glycosyltransferase involved in cell wall biosynthesis